MTASTEVLKKHKKRRDRRTHPIFNRYWYRLNSRFFTNDDTVFLNWGYEEDPPMALPLTETDEPDGAPSSCTIAWRPKWTSPANVCSR